MQASAGNNNIAESILLRLDPMLRYIFLFIYLPAVPPAPATKQPFSLIALIDLPSSPSTLPFCLPTLPFIMQSQIFKTKYALCRGEQAFSPAIFGRAN